MQPTTGSAAAAKTKSPSAATAAAATVVDTPQSSTVPPLVAPTPSLTYAQALSNYVESYAGYSLFCYLFAVKDRHNGNILIDRDGHILHIDFGFMLANSPGGNWNFESCPFKLTQEYLDVFGPGGVGSDMFHYFELLFVRGFLELRAHNEELCMFIAAISSHSYMPCFLNGHDGAFTVQQLKQRFFLHCGENECIANLQALIHSSVNHWRSQQYDTFQKWSNNID